MGLPKPFKCLSKTWTIEYGAPFDGAYGHTHDIQCSIIVQENLDSALEKETVWHELEHVCWGAAGIDGKIKEEEAVTRVSPIMYDTLTRKENKSLFDYLFGVG